MVIIPVAWQLRLNSLTAPAAARTLREELVICWASQLGQQEAVTVDLSSVEYPDNGITVDLEIVAWHALCCPA
jgi:hypothetical protein